MILLKKALRSIWRGKRSFAACILLIALGVAAQVGFSGAGEHLVEAVESFYGAQDFGDAFASVRGVSESAAATLTRVDGVAAVSWQTAVTARVLRDGAEQLSLRVLSIDPEREDALSRPLVIEGRLPGRGEIAVSRTFFAAQGLSLGDAVAVSANGHQLRPVVTGVVLSPDYILEVGEGLTGDGASAGYAYMLLPEVGALAGSGGYHNQLSFRLEEGVRFEAVEADLEEALTPYGLVSLYGREDHLGHKNVWENITSLSATAGMIAAIFLGIAVLVLTILLRRVIEQERTQIGTLKAFGLSARGLLILYLLYGAVISLTGGALGVLGGMGVARWAAGLYYGVFPMPVIAFSPPLSLAGSALLAALLAGLVGAGLGARSVLRLGPAEAMRPAAPRVKRVRRARNRASRLPASLALALRGISRGRGRSAFVAGGMALSFAILSFMGSYAAMMDEVMLAEFDHAQLYDLKLSLNEARRHRDAVQSAASLVEVEEAEGLLELAVTFHKAHLQEDGSLTGLTREGTMRRLYDSESGQTLELPAEGAVLSRSLAEKLEVAVGDRVEFTTAHTGEDRFGVTVTALLAENSGSAAYLELGELCGLLGAQETVNGLLVRTGNAAAVIEALREGENVAAMVDQAEQRTLMQNALDQSLGANLALFLVIGLGVAFAIIAATASISLSERAREYATMRVLGMEPRRIGAVLVLEYLLLAAVGFLPGVPLTVGLKAMMMSSFSTESIYLSPGVSPASFALGGAVCLVTVLLANISSVRQIARLDMKAVLGERE